MFTRRAAVFITFACGVAFGCEATAPATPAVFVSPARLALQDGDTAKLTATLRNPRSRQVTWSSSNAAVARVDIAGLVTAVTNGTATITARMVDDSSRAASAEVAVIGPAVETVEISPASGVVYVGRTGRLTVTLRARDGRLVRGRTVSWSTPDPAVADVSTSGLVTGRAAGGPITVVAASEGHSGSSRIRVAHSAEQCPVVTPVTIGQSLAGSLAFGDCELPLDGSYVDVYEITLATAATIQIDLTSPDFDAYLGVFERSGPLLAQDDNSGGGTQARLSVSLAAGAYRIWANTQVSGQTGRYGLTVVQR